MSEKTSFELLHEGVRRQLWKMGWGSLRPLQVDAIRHVLTTTDHLVLSAGTASGKTEAAFLPVLSAIADEGTGSIRAIYVGPLKALINDQFSRVEELCGHLDVPVHRWHGDVSASEKTKLVNAPGGVLLITPESLESMFVNRSNALGRLFGGLRFIVIDELHSFLSNERGRHLRSLIYRIEKFASHPPRLIGLSATIGEPQHAIDYLDRDQPGRVKWIEGDKAETELKLKLHAYIDDIPVDETPDAKEAAEQARDQAIAFDVVKHCRGSTNLIFTNARNDVELFGDRCSELAATQGLTDRFLVHHGSLTADTRQDAELTMKQASRGGLPATTICSSTLEMGIDIGSVTMVGQIGAPYAVASLKQRVGRSGRRNGAARVLRMYVRCNRCDDKSTIFERLHLELIQAIAITELMLEGWVEPAEPTSFDLSTLTQQIVSEIAETGVRYAKDLFESLCKTGAFRDVDSSIFASLLSQLAAKDVIEQTSRGELILGLVGERIRKDKGFYACFTTADGFTVLHAGEKIGTVDSPPLPEQCLVLRGRRWQAVDVDLEGKTIFVIPARGFKPAVFSGSRGLLHDEIVLKMRVVLASSTQYSYLNPTAARLLGEAREFAALSGVCSHRVVSLSANKSAVMAWLGGRSMETLAAMFRAAGAEAEADIIVVQVKRPSIETTALLDRLMDAQLDPNQLLPHLRPGPSAKYDGLLDVSLRERIKHCCWLDDKTVGKFQRVWPKV